MIFVHGNYSLVEVSMVNKKATVNCSSVMGHKHKLTNSGFLNGSQTRYTPMHHPDHCPLTYHLVSANLCTELSSMI